MIAHLKVREHIEDEALLDCLTHTVEMEMAREALNDRSRRPGALANKLPQRESRIRHT
jgi:hypothetical protein